MNASNDIHTHIWWLASRSAGVVALVCVAASVIIGLTLANRLGGPPARRRALVAVHEHTAIVGLVAIALHGALLLGDPWLRPGLAGILVPFVARYRPLFTGLGILGGYLAALLGLSFYARRRVGAKRWRTLHRATPLVYALGLAHTLGAGTDAGTPWLRAFMIASALPISALLVLRLAGGRRGSPVRGRPAQRAVTEAGS
jgi:sulfoxide reductase heme-binding subunit YedZ